MPYYRWPHLKNLTRPSAVNGEFTISGALSKPDTIEVKVNISEISFDYQFVQLQNDCPIRIIYHRNEVRIEQAHIHGPNTDMQRAALRVSTASARSISIYPVASICALPKD